MISTNSPVMTACLVLLNRIWNLLIMSPAFLEALSMALRRADCSQAWPSASAQKRLLARAYSRRLARTSSSISKAAKLAVRTCQWITGIGGDWTWGLRDSLIASSE